MLKPLIVAVNNGQYHGCFKVYKNGMRPFTEKGDHPHPTKDNWCYLSTNDSFSKHVKDVDFTVQTREQKEKNEIAKKQEIIDYLSV